MFTPLFVCIVYYFCYLLILEPFITVWLGGEYLLGHVVLVLLCLKMYVQVMAGKTYAFIYGYGLFADVWAAIVQSAIFLVVAIWVDIIMVFLVLLLLVL